MHGLQICVTSHRACNVSQCDLSIIRAKVDPRHIDRNRILQPLSLPTLKPVNGFDISLTLCCAQSSSRLCPTGGLAHYTGCWAEDARWSIDLGELVQNASPNLQY